MSRIEDRLLTALKAMPTRPAENAPQAAKKNWTQALSDSFALVIAAELRDRGLTGARPSGPGELGPSGAERRLAGGLGAKKTDVSWATEESGLVLAVSVKCIMWRDGASKNFQKNLTNRRGDLLFETTTLHRRFPYAVIVGLLFVDADAEHDDTPRRKSTFKNFFPRFRLFTRRPDPQGREEMFERLYIVLTDTNAFAPTVRAYEAHDEHTRVDLGIALDEVLELVGERNFDLYDGTDGVIKKIGRGG